MNAKRSNISLTEYARGHLVGARFTAAQLREQVEIYLAQGSEVIFDFSGVEATQSFIDELVGVLILRHSPDILSRLIFRFFINCTVILFSMVENLVFQTHRQHHERYRPVRNPSWTAIALVCKAC